MDLRTVKSRIKCGGYGSIDEFVRDMFLIFSNCIKYNKWNSKLGKTATNLKRYFEKRCNNLGLKDLNLTRPETAGKGSGTRRRSDRLKN